MIDQENIELYKQAMNERGIDFNIEKLVEELCEAAAAAIRAKHSKDMSAVADFLGELVDVHLCMQTILTLFPEELIDTILHQKMERFGRRYRKKGNKNAIR